MILEQERNKSIAVAIRFAHHADNKEFKRYLKTK
jgi:hypothetical protein